MQQFMSLFIQREKIAEARDGVHWAVFRLCLADSSDGKRPTLQPPAVKFMVKRKPAQKLDDEKPVKKEDIVEQGNTVSSNGLLSLCQYDSDE